MYSVFIRSWWKNNPNWPGGLEPHMGRKSYIKRHVKTIEEARDICRVWNANHSPGRFSRKAEFESE